VLRERLRRHEILGPTLYTSGPSFNGTSAPDPQTARRMVLEQKAAGYDFLKIHPGLSRETFDMLARTADSVGIRFAGHVPAAVGLDRALAARYASIDHLDGYVERLAGWTPGAGPEGFFGLLLADRVDTALIAELARRIPLRRFGRPDELVGAAVDAFGAVDIAVNNDDPSQAIFILILLLKPTGLSATQYNVLRILRGAGPEGLACREVGCRMISRDPDITRLMDRMESRGLIARARGEEDRRVVKSRLTAEGLRILVELDAPVQELHRRQLDHLPAKELRQLSRLLERARTHVETTCSPE